MSTTIDERVVEMRFDNKQFESNVSTSMSTLKKLKESLKFTGATKGLEEIDAASRRVNMSGLGSAVDSVKAKFSAMDVVAVTTLANITNSAVNAGKRMISALTIEPITTGFKEYETQINAVQTILANTSAKGTTIDQVNDALDELNKYADLTIYNFTEMTRNIGTFTAAGIDLDTSVNAIQGIANLAAVSGSTSQQASTAMYQLSQALASGTVKLQDWNSVVNAGMGGEIFQNALKETSRLLGTGADEAIEASGSFRESLKAGWITSEVLTETLKKFTTSGAAEYISKFTGLTQETVDATLKATDAWGDEADAIDKAAEALAEKSGKNKDEIKAALQMAKNAQDAATKVKTFTQLWDVMKEAAQSGWSQTWRLVIGDFEEAKSLLTPLADFFTGIIGKMSDWRNDLLEGALGKGFGSLSENISSIISPVTKATEVVSNLGNTVDKVINGDYTKDQISAQDELLEKQENVSEATGKQEEATKKLTEADKKRLALLLSMGDAQLRAKGYTNEQIAALKELKSTAEKLGIPLNDFINNLEEINGRWLLLNSFKNIGTALIKVFSAIADAWRGIFSPIQSDQIFNVVAAFHKFTASLIPSEETVKLLTRTFKGLFSVLDVIKSLVGGGLKFAFDAVSSLFKGLDLGILDYTASIGDMLVALRDWIAENNIFGKVFDWLLTKFESGVNAIRNWVGDLIESFKNTETFKQFESALGDLGDAFRKFRNGEIDIFDLGFYISDFAGKVLLAIPAVREWFDVFKESPRFQVWVDAFAELGRQVDAFRNGDIGILELAKAFGDYVSKVLTAIPVIEKWVNDFKGWVDSFKNIPAVQQFANAIYDIVEAFNKFKSGDINFAEFGTTLGENLAKALTALPEILRSVGKGFSDGAQQIASDFIQGFQNGIVGKVSEVITNIVNFCTNFISSFKEALGEHSPSVIAEEAGTNFIQGFINGIKAAIGSVIDAITGVGEKIVGAFGTVWDKITEVAGKIDWGRLFAGGSIVALIYSAVTISNAISRISKAISGIGDLVASAKKVLDNFSIVLKSFGKVLDGIAWDFKAKALLKMAIAIGILAAAVWLLAQIPSENIGMVLTAVGVIIVLAGVMVALGFAMSKMGQASVDLKNKSAEVKGVNTTLLQIAIALFAVAAAVKMLGSMDDAALKKGLLSMAGITVALIVSVAILGKMSEKSKDVDKFGILMLKLAGAFLIMALVAKLLGGMDPLELLQGTLAITAFGGIIVGLMAATKLITGSKNVGEIGGALLKIAAAIAMMALVAKLLGGMDPLALLQGTLAVTAFGGIIVGLMAATKLITGSKNVERIGAALLGVSGAIAIIAGVAILLSFMSWESFAKGAVMVTAFAGIIVGLMAATKLIGRSEQIATVGKTLMMVSGAIAILSGIAVLLGMIPTENLVKGLAAVVVLGVVMAGLIAVTSLAKKCIGTLIVLTVMIAVMAACVWALSAMPNSDKALTSALALGGLRLAITAVIFILSKIDSGTGKALLGVIGLAAIGLVLREFVWVLSSMEGLENARSNALTLVILAGACTAMVAVLTLVGFGALAAIAGVAALALLGLALREFVWVLSTMEGLTDAEANASILIRLMETLGGVLVKISLLGPLAIVGEASVLGLVGLIGVIGIMATAVGALMTKFPNIQKFLDTGIPVLEQLAEGIGSMIGKLVGGVISGIGDSIINTLPRLGIALSAFMVGASPFIAIAKSVDSSVVTGAGCIAAAILVLTGANFISGITSLLTFGQSSFEELGKQLVTFGLGASVFAKSISGIDDGAIESASNVSEMILTLTKAEFVTGLMDLFGAGIDFEALGERLNAFGEAVVGFSNTISGNIDPEAVNAATNAGNMLVSLNQALPRSGGWIQDIIGEKDFDKFATACGSFAKCILTINATLSQDGVEIQSEKIEQLTKAGTQFSELNNALPRSGGVAQDLAGEKDLSKFGQACTAFATCMIAINATLSQDGVDIQSDKLAALTKAGTQFSDLNNALPRAGGVAQDLAGEQDLSVFGEACEAFATCMIGVNAAVSQEGFSVNLEAIEQLKQAGLKMNELQEALPKSDGWWQKVAGSENIGDFGEKIQTFAEAIFNFSEKAKELDSTGIDTAILTSYRMKALITSIKDIDYDGVSDFTGVGFGQGGRGADGPLYKIGLAIAAFSDSLSGINTENINVAVDAADKLRKLITDLVGIDYSGVELFKPEPIGTAIESYSDNISDIDIEKISTSITCANRLKTFISGLIDLDSSGVTNFTPESIGGALLAYNTQIAGIDNAKISSTIAISNRLKTLISELADLDNSGISKFTPVPIATSLSKYCASANGFDAGKIDSSITAATKLKTFIAGLAELDTSGVETFKAAIAELSTLNIATLVESLAAASETMHSSGSQMIGMLAKAFNEGARKVSTSATKVVTTAKTTIASKKGDFRTAGQTLISSFASGLSSSNSTISSNASTAAYNAVTGARSQRSNMYQAGVYVLEGFKNGLKDPDMLHAIHDAGRKAGKLAVDSVDGGAQNGSPSKATRQSGIYVGEGFVLGLESMYSNVRNSGTELGASAIDGTRSAMSTLLDTLNTDMDMQPTIRPVVDLSDVRTGAAAVSGIFGNVQTVGVRSNLNAINLAMNSRSQNRGNDDIISAINKLGDGLANNRGDTYNFGDFTYDDGSNVANAVGELIRYAKIGRRV